MNDNQINSLKRELFNARWFISGLEAQTRDFHRWDEDKHKAFIQSLRGDIAHTTEKLNVQQEYRDNEGYRCEDGKTTTP